MSTNASTHDAHISWAKLCQRPVVPVGITIFDSCKQRPSRRYSFCMCTRGKLRGLQVQASAPLAVEVRAQLIQQFTMNSRAVTLILSCMAILEPHGPLAHRQGNSLRQRQMREQGSDKSLQKEQETRLGVALGSLAPCWPLASTRPR